MSPELSEIGYQPSLYVVNVELEVSCFTVFADLHKLYKAESSNITYKNVKTDIFIFEEVKLFLFGFSTFEFLIYLIKINMLPCSDLCKGSAGLCFLQDCYDATSDFLGMV